MRRALIVHPSTPSQAVDTLDVEAERQGALLALRYSLRGRISALKIPPPAMPTRADELWQHTCFEAFIALPGGAYCEFNFSPSSQWAAYRFDGYREDMAALEIEPPAMELRRKGDRLDMDVALDLTPVAGLLKDKPSRLALTAVIEEAGAAKSYWALAHPQGKPDFHHADGFVLDLGHAERT